MTVLRTPDERFEGLPDFAFAPHYVTVDGASLGPLRMHYLDEGPPDARPVVLVHGEPTWAFMFRHSIGPLVEAGLRVIVPDLVGFGRSDKPASTGDYTYDSHLRWLVDLLAQLYVSDAVLVGHDWGGLLGLRAATTVPGLAASYVATNHGYPTGDMPANDALRSWQEYAATVEVLDVGPAVARACSTSLAPEVVDAYDAPFPDESYKAGARVFPALIPVTPDDPAAQAVRDSRAVLARSSMPFLTAYGENDPIAGAADAMFQQLVPGAAGLDHVRFAKGGHNVPEDCGEELGQIVAAFARRLS